MLTPSTLFFAVFALSAPAFASLEDGMAVSVGVAEVALIDVRDLHASARAHDPLESFEKGGSPFWAGRLSMAMNLLFKHRDGAKIVLGKLKEAAERSSENPVAAQLNGAVFDGMLEDLQYVRSCVPRIASKKPIPGLASIEADRAGCPKISTYGEYASFLAFTQSTLSRYIQMLKPSDR